MLSWKRRVYLPGVPLTVVSKDPGTDPTRSQFVSICLISFIHSFLDFAAKFHLMHVTVESSISSPIYSL